MVGLIMKQSEHQWARFYSPRNGRISIQACHICGIAKGIVTGDHECSPVEDEVRMARLRGWSQKVLDQPSDGHTLEIGNH